MSELLNQNSDQFTSNGGYVNLLVNLHVRFLHVVVKSLIEICHQIIPIGVHANIIDGIADQHLKSQIDYFICQSRMNTKVFYV